ncbi:hypothetical protein KP509_12G063400 [Ceratopteris richardii]|uniref:EF-hand domain-containing protein n=1 Tax=Ceratopteris richardii TaxID=49495 RepID=A0A8T2TLP4_CERRI|nr:hypothetical protein KP509_12G063400 [Ceratopteris richardii]
MEELGKALVADCAAICNDPHYQRSCHVRNLRNCVRQWAQENKRMKKVDGELASSIQACARLEQSLNCGTDLDTYKCNQDQIASLHLAAEAVLAVEESRASMAQKNKAALDASLLLFGAKGVIPRPDQLGVAPPGMPPRTDGKPLVKTWTEGWQPRWEGDLGDPFEPYQQLIEQHLHGAIVYHSKALEHLSTAFGAVQRARKIARDYAYLRTLAAAAGISVKEYQRLLEMFRKIDHGNTGTISKKDLMSAMKRDKDIAAFMQLSRAKGKDGRRESFDSVFNRIDAQGLGVVTWEAFLHFFSGDISLVGIDSNLPPPPILTPAPINTPAPIITAAPALPPSPMAAGKP